MEGCIITLISKQVQKAHYCLTSKVGIVCFFPRGASKNNCSLAPVLTCKSFPIKHITYCILTLNRKFHFTKKKKKIFWKFSYTNYLFPLEKEAYISSGSGPMAFWNLRPLTPYIHSPSSSHNASHTGSNSELACDNWLTSMHLLLGQRSPQAAWSTAASKQLTSTCPYFFCEGNSHARFWLFPVFRILQGS